MRPRSVPVVLLGLSLCAACRDSSPDAAAEGAPTTSFAVDHTGRNADNVSFVIDPSGAGWYGVAIASDEAWSTTGCTIDEL